MRVGSFTLREWAEAAHDGPNAVLTLNLCAVPPTMPPMPARAEHLIDELRLAPHPEGGHFRRIHESTLTVERDGRSRPALTAIHFLLARGEASQWHRVDADESWHWQEGGALELLVFDPVAGTLASTVLDRSGLGVPMHVVPAGHWQAARPLGDYTLVACTVSPGFVWEGFELLGEGGDVVDALAKAGGLPL